MIWRRSSEANRPDWPNVSLKNRSKLKLNLPDRSLRTPFELTRLNEFFRSPDFLSYLFGADQPKSEQEVANATGDNSTVAGTDGTKKYICNPRNFTSNQVFIQPSSSVFKRHSRAAVLVQRELSDGETPRSSCNDLQRLASTSTAWQLPELV